MMRRLVVAGGLILAACSGGETAHITSSVDLAVSGDQVKTETPPAAASTFATPTSAPDVSPALEETPPAAPASAPAAKPADKPAPGHVALKYLMGNVDPANDP